MSAQGNAKAVHSLTERLQVTLDNGAQWTLISIENRRLLFDGSPTFSSMSNPSCPVACTRSRGGP